MLTRERIEEIRVAVGDASADPMAPAELAELLAARDVAEAAERVERDERDGPPDEPDTIGNDAHEAISRSDYDKALRRYEQAKRGASRGVLLHTINRESEARA